RVPHWYAISLACSISIAISSTLLVAELEGTTARLTEQLNKEQDKLAAADGLAEARRLKVLELEAKIAKQKEYIEYMEDKARVDEAMRRQLHNTIQELKGNIRVICRVRPLLGKEGSEGVRYDVPPKSTQ